MSSERHLISKILHDGDLASVADAGITPAFFLNSDHRSAFEVILEHQAEYSSVPSEEAFRGDFPESTYKLSKAPDTMAYYLDQVIRDYRLYLLERGLSEAVDLYDDGDEVESQNAIARTLNQLNQEIVGSRVVDLTDEGQIKRRLERYRAYSNHEGSLKGIPTGFHSLDSVTGGLQRKQLWTFVGPPKAGKSTIMLLAMMAAHRAFYNPLFIGFEMSNEEQEERHDAIRAGIDHKALREGTLSTEEWRALEKMTRRLDSMPPLIFSEDANSTLTLSGVASQVEKYKPDAIFVDGVYMMEDENGERKGSPQAITNITRGFKQMAKNMNIGAAISTQVLEWKMDRKRGVTSNSIGYSSSFIQDSDQIVSVEKTDDENVNKLKVIMGRNNAGMERYVLWDWKTGSFTELEDDYDPDAGEESGTPKF